VKTEHQANSKREAYELAYGIVSGNTHAEGACVLLVPSYDETVRVKCDLANTGIGFGVTVKTVKAWLADLWELFGDGRVIAGSVERALFVRRALKEHVLAAKEEGQEPFFELTSGTEALVERLVRDAASAVIDASHHPDAYVLSDVQRCVVEVAAKARRDMARAGLIEQSRVCDKLREWGVLEGVKVVVVACETSVAEDRLFDAIGADVVLLAEERNLVEGRAKELNDLVERLYRPDFERPIVPSGAVQFAYPAGRYASGQVLADEIVRAVEELGSTDTRVAVASPHPLDVFDALASRLVKHGANVRVSCMTNFAETAFGCAWNALLGFVLDDEIDVLRAGDFSLSNFSSMTLSGAYGLDARLRGWRGETVEDALTDMVAYADDDWREFLSLFAEGDYLGALDAQTRWVATRQNWAEAYRAQQLRSVHVARGVHERAAQIGLDLDDALEILQRITMPYEAEVGVGAEVGRERKNEVGRERKNETPTFTVLIGSMAQIVQGPSDDFDIVVVESLDAESYPLKDEETSVDALLQALDAWKPARRVEKLRLRFARSIACATSRVILHRVLNTVDAEESRPAALLEELVDCYRRDPSDPDEIDKDTGLTEGLQAHCSSVGEEELAGLLDKTGDPAPLDREVDVYSTGYLACGDTENLLPPSKNEDGELLETAVLSPSAIELYLECPYKWFSQRRLKIESIDAEFGPLAFGSFAHKVFEALHEQLRVTGLRRVTSSNLAECDRLLDWQFDRLFEDEHYTYNKNAFIPLTQLERLKAEQLRRELHDFLRREAELLPDFEPWKHELKFGWDTPFEYAGVPIRGSIDRVDVDAGGRAVIFDYKQSVGSAYAFWPKDENVESPLQDANGRAIVLPRKMQALIYAQVVCRLMGLVPVAAVYVGYGKKAGIAGLFDKRVLHPEVDLGGINPKRCGTSEMLDVLDRCEEAVALRLAGLMQGEIAPCPLDEEACRYCPVVCCDVRDGVVAGKEA
jgi:hypothetical protein